MENWEKLKEEIIVETKSYYQDKNTDVGELVDLLQKVLMARIDEKYQLDGVAVNVPKAMYDILDEDTTRKQQILNFAIINKFEPFLRKVLFLVNPQKFQEITDDKRGLAAIINALSLNPNRVNFFHKSENDQRRYTDYDYHLFRAYSLRNAESHVMELWGSRELAENIETIFIIYLESLNFHKEELANVLLRYENDFSGYIASVITEFESNATKYVYTESIEDFSMFESYAFEHKNVVSEDSEQERSGTVDYIRKNCLPEKRMMLWGDAGMGKSTTLQYLTYMDARDYKQGESNIIPVYVPLGMLISPEETIIQYVCKKIGVEYLTGTELFAKGGVSLFLDGVNEIPADSETGIQTLRLRELQSILDDYPRMLVVISNRPDNFNFFKEIPVFRLQKMDLKKIWEFLEKNTDSEAIREVILNGIDQNHRLLKLIGTPLMATRLVEIVRDLKELPQSEGTIIKKFLESLYKREKFEKKDTRFDEFKINYLLTYLAAYGFRKNGTNSGLSHYEVLECFGKCMERYHFTYDSTYALEILLSLGVLGSDKGREVIVFSHQAYQDYYVSCADKIGTDAVLSAPEEQSSEDREDDFFEKYANDGKHEKSIIYRLHTTERASRNEEIIKLAEHNLLLAAKTISSDEPDEKIEQYIVDKAKEKIAGTDDPDAKLESIMVFLELNRTMELRENIPIIVSSCYTDNPGLLRDIAMELSGDQCVAFIDAFRMQASDLAIRSLLAPTFEIFKLKDYEYTWTPDNVNVIKDITSDMNSVFKSSPYNLVMFYLAFNVPKEFISEDLTKQMNKVFIKHDDLAREFVERYGISYDMSQDNMLAIYMNSGGYLARRKALVMISRMPEQEKIETIKKYLTMKKNMRTAVYLQLSDEDQYEITRQFNVYYYGGGKTGLYVPGFLTKEEARHIVFDHKMMREFSKDVQSKKKGLEELRFAGYLRMTRPELKDKGDVEVLDLSTLEDFINFKEFFHATLTEKRRKKHKK